MLEHSGPLLRPYISLPIRAERLGNDVRQSLSDFHDIVLFDMDYVVHYIKMKRQMEDIAM